MRKRLLATSVASGLVLLFGLVGAPLAQAFSAYGAGTSENPYRIATCDQLSEIDNGLAADYVIIRNLDCTGVAFNTLAQSNPFTGTLDGQWHTITNLVIASGTGLFDTTDGATIKNLSISGGSLDGVLVGSFVGTAEDDSVLQGLHSTMAVTGYAYCGGLVSMLQSGSSIDSSSYSGTLSCGDFSGGLAATMGNGSISNSFSAGTLDGAATRQGFGTIGGLVGSMGGSITNSYSSMDLELNSGPQNVGGLVGQAGGVNEGDVISSSFSAATIHLLAGGYEIGGIDGTYQGSDNVGLTDVFFDQTQAGGIDCNEGGPMDGCTAVNTDGTDGDHFKNTTSAAPLSSWDFGGTWQKTNGYPTLFDLANEFSTSYGDLNGDGTDDSFQPTVETDVDEQGDTPINTTVTIPTNSTCTLDQASWVEVDYYKTDTGFTNPNRNFTAFNVYCPTAGMTVPVTIVFDTAYDTSHAVLQYFDMNTHTYTTVPNATFATQTINGTLHTTVTYNLTDGGPYDSDGVANGLIQDPVGMVVPASSAGSTSPGDTGTLTDTGLDVTLTASLAVTIMALAVVIRLLPALRKG